MYYDEKGDLIGASIKNGYGKEVFTDEKGNITRNKRLNKEILSYDRVFS